MEVGGQRHTPAALSPGKTRHPMYRRQGGPQGLSWRVRKILAPQPGFDPQTMHTSSAGYGTACLLQIRLLFFATPREAKKLSPPQPVQSHPRIRSYFPQTQLNINPAQVCLHTVRFSLVNSPHDYRSSSFIKFVLHSSPIPPSQH